MPRLRICTWNIQMGQRLDEVLHVVRGESSFRNLDVLALQEASHHSHVDDAGVIAGALGNSYRHHQVTAQHFRAHPQANALVWNETRLKTHQVAHIDLPAVAHSSDLPFLEHWLLRRFPAQRRGAVVLEAEIEGGQSLRVYSLHADVVGFAHRRRQLGAALADNASREHAHMVILAADLNTFGTGTFPSWSALRAGAQAAGFRDVTTEVVWTHVVPRFPLRQKLDAVFVADRATLHSRAWTVTTSASDHVPLFVDLEWP